MQIMLCLMCLLEVPLLLTPLIKKHSNVPYLHTSRGTTKAERDYSFDLFNANAVSPLNNCMSTVCNSQWNSLRIMAVFRLTDTLGAQHSRCLEIAGIDMLGLLLGPLCKQCVTGCLCFIFGRKPTKRNHLIHLII